MSWPGQLYERLRHHEVTLFAYVPDAGHQTLIQRSIDDPQAHAVALTTEEEGVALMAGADLGGSRGVLLMQSSGLGNCVNFLSLVKSGKFPFLTIISMRGDFGEANPWQMPMGQATHAILKAMGVIGMRIEREEDVLSTAEAGITMAYKGGNAVALLLSQKLLGAKAF